MLHDWRLRARILLKLRRPPVWSQFECNLWSAAVASWQQVLHVSNNHSVYRRRRPTSCCRFWLSSSQSRLKSYSWFVLRERVRGNASFTCLSSTEATVTPSAADILPLDTNQLGHCIPKLKPIPQPKPVPQPKKLPKLKPIPESKLVPHIVPMLRMRRII